MTVVLTATLRVTDWRALSRWIRDELVQRAREVGGSRPRIFRDVSDASEALVWAEAPDQETGLDLILVLASPPGAVLASGPETERVWEETEL